jgi:hypothetical protein
MAEVRSRNDARDDAASQTVAAVCKEREMTKQLWFRATGMCLLTFTLGCSQQGPTAPSSLASEDLDTALGSTASTTSSYPVVTLEPDGRVNPASVTVPVGGKILMVNHSPQYLLIRSYNCSQFATMGLRAGAARHTMVFYDGGVTCDFFAWQEYGKKWYEGQVTVR